MVDCICIGSWKDVLGIPYWSILVICSSAAHMLMIGSLLTCRTVLVDSRNCYYHFRRCLILNDGCNYLCSRLGKCLTLCTIVVTDIWLCTELEFTIVTTVTVAHLKELFQHVTVCTHLFFIGINTCLWYLAGEVLQGTRTWNRQVKWCKNKLNSCISYWQFRYSIQLKKSIKKSLLLPIQNWGI